MIGGMAAFILQLFHQYEKKIAEGTWDIPCKWAKCEVAETQQAEVQGGSNQTTSQGQNERLLSQVIHTSMYAVYKHYTVAIHGTWTLLKFGD